MKHCQEQTNNHDKAIFMTIKMETTWKRNNEKFLKLPIEMRIAL